MQPATAKGIIRILESLTPDTAHGCTEDLPKSDPARKPSCSVSTIHTPAVKDLPKHQITHTAPQPCSHLRQGRFDISCTKSCIWKFKYMLQAAAALQSAFADLTPWDTFKQLSPHLLHASEHREIRPKCLIPQYGQLVCTDPVLCHQAHLRAEHEQLVSSKADTGRSRVSPRFT